MIFGFAQNVKNSSARSYNAKEYSSILSFLGFLLTRQIKHAGIKEVK